MRTIKSSSEITNIFECGQRIGTPDVNFIVMRNDELHDQSGRVAFIAGKKFGNAVWRNRAKRRMRGLGVELGAPFKGYDVVFLARRTINEASFEIMKRNAVKALGKHGIL